MRVDTTGKVSLDHIYTSPDPRDYFGTLRGLDYQIPQLAKPYFARLIREYRQARRVPVANVLDIGCSYGINAALLRCDATMDELYERYAGPDAAGYTRDSLLARDRRLVRARGHLEQARFIGLDTSHHALSYALAAGFLDAAVHADLEGRDPTEQERGRLATADLVVSTGCLGYVTEKTLSRVIAAHGERLPWMAHFVLRMFPFDPVAECLAEAGYETARVDRVFAQRQFATAQEQALVLDRLADVGVDPRGLESDGRLYAQLYISRPRGTKDCTTMDLAPPRKQPPNRPDRGST
ncbi:class I SAM-dependent methyltransferase [Actinomadura craniellae]|uniref:Class I SAM-dependent methyltransferase n=1 Tax=Actinomadura craniellae TaxID=2231787 RepID=A0A365GVY7_9ACTN|nr:class I SAM-dependent methyltransferase [Actinomadura craniellae]RAY10989.1 class I SAM-dependent methyltransferase [Actinomadura craniellae]